ncbi:MAG: GNAT family N-acetyltransferase [Actinomycetota bacterium]
MAETARLSDLNDEEHFTDLFTAARVEAATRKGFKLWDQIDSVGDVPATAFHEFMSNARKEIVLGEYDSYPLGYMLLELVTIGPDIATNIHEVFVHIDAREVGIGEAIMNFAIDWSRANGSSLLIGRTFPGDRATKNYFERFHITARLIEVSKQL